MENQTLSDLAYESNERDVILFQDVKSFLKEILVELKKFEDPIRNDKGSGEYALIQVFKHILLDKAGKELLE